MRLTSDAKRVSFCLAAIALSLLVVGIISGTLARHAVQIVPVVLALAILLGRPADGAYVAIPVFAFWTCIMALIWLYLLGVSDVAEGTYSTPEIMLTILVAGCSAWGVPSSLRAGRQLSLPRRIALILGGFVLQVAFMVVSLKSHFAN